MGTSQQVNFFGAFTRRSARSAGVTRHADIADITRVLRANYEAKGRGGSKVHLVDVIEADFRQSEKTILADYMQVCRRKNYKWKENHTFLAISKNRKLALWFVGETKINNSVVVDTRKWRLIGSENWTIDNVQFYARQVGLDLALPGRSTIAEFQEGAI